MSARTRWSLVVALCCLTLVGAWWTKARCLSDGTWTQGEEYFAWCYTDVFPLWTVERLHEGARPYLDHPVEYPVLTGLQMWVAAQVPYATGGGAVAFFHTTAAMGALFVLLTLVVLRREGLPPRRLLWWALSPTLLIFAFLNWDPLPVLLLVLGVARHRAGDDLGAGLAAGLGAAAKLFPGVLVPLVVAARLAQGRRRDALVHAAAAAGAWLVVNVPILLAAPDGWLRFLELNRERPSNFDSLWYVGAQVTGAGVFDTSAVNRWSALLFLAGAIALCVVGARRLDPSRWWVLCLPVLCWFLVTNKVYSPQYSLWVVPLMALALRRFAPFAAFCVADALVFLVEFPFLGTLTTEGAALPFGVLGWALAIRAGVLVWVALEVVAGPFGPDDLREPAPQAAPAARGPDPAGTA